MLAYNNTGLDHLNIQQEAATAYRKKCITDQEHAAVQGAYPVDFYTPNPYIRIGLFILTLVILSASLGLFGLLLLEALPDIYAGLIIFAGLAIYGILEYFVQSKKHYQSGVDDALLWMSAALILCGLNLMMDLEISVFAQCMLVFLIALYAALRFADTLMSVVAYLALLSMVFERATVLGDFAKLILPFLLLAISLVVYLLMKRGEQLSTFRHYKQCFMVVQIVALVTLYISGNYFVVRETSNMLFGLDPEEGQGIPLGWLFWMLTVAIPVIYIYLGLKKKDTILLRAGLILVAAIVFTIRYYHSVAPLEVAMLIGGLVLIGAAYGCIKYLKTPRYGLTDENTDDPHFLDKLHLESVIIAETYTPQAPVTDDFQFGGGTGGGGGASGTY